jgi:hypothetical protein
MTSTHDGRRSIGRETARSVGKVLFGAFALVLLTYLVTLLPGVGRLVPGTAITFGLLLRGIGTVAVVAALLYAAPGLATLTRASVPARPLAENVASVVYWLVVLAAVLVAHWGLSSLAGVSLGGATWLYDTAFLLAALGPLAVVAARLYVTIDPAADLFADKVSGSGEA